MSPEQSGFGDAATGLPADAAAEQPRKVTAGSETAGNGSQEQLQTIEQQVRHTRISATWVAIISAILLLVLLLIFILENLQNVTVSYFGASGQLPLGVALLFAAIGGALLVAIVGVARLTQLRLNARSRRRASVHTQNEPHH